ncbi:hypothetical protein BV22DRAFT_781903 [Leucogyrophana mollusca]|uniref:Uncharacterized protein n=1 Tax=Leucogyrophana mollusca TaxID=85980 RepID=A0ACB8B4T1_9AGAM|nr:hypothetical protein BV22DRAFT_781903 [Leucogyrophana mollusca]
MYTLTLALVALAYLDCLIRTKERPDLPGPRGVPLLGNPSRILPHHGHMPKRYLALERHYGELFTCEEAHLGVI